MPKNNKLKFGMQTVSKAKFYEDSLEGENL